MDKVPVSILNPALSGAVVSLPGSGDESSGLLMI
jgi:hypothetical protein